MEKLFQFEECPTGWGIGRKSYTDDLRFLVGDLLLPNTRKNGEPITEISWNSFSESGGDISGVIIPSNYLVIGDSAFNSCWELNYVDMSQSSIQLIGSGAFMDCVHLQHVEFSDCLRVIGVLAFYNTRLRAVHLPKSLKIVGTNCFAHCKELTCITVSAKNRNYDSRDNCNAVIETRTNTLVAGCNTTTIPETVTALGEDAFYGSAIHRLVIPASIQSIGPKCFLNCELQELHIPSDKRHLLEETQLSHKCEIIEY